MKDSYVWNHTSPGCPSEEVGALSSMKNRGALRLLHSAPCTTEASSSPHLGVPPRSGVGYLDQISESRGSEDVEEVVYLGGVVRGVGDCGGPSYSEEGSSRGSVVIEIEGWRSYGGVVCGHDGVYEVVEVRGPRRCERGYLVGVEIV